MSVKMWEHIFQGEPQCEDAVTGPSSAGGHTLQPRHQEKPPQLSEDNLVISALNEEKRSIRAPQSATIGDALSGDNISLIFYETIR